MRPTQESIRYVGLDVHKVQIRTCILNADGQIESEQTILATRQSIDNFARTQLRQTDQLTLEATSNTWAIVDLLRTHVDRIVVANPMKTRMIADSKIKTDKIDACVLAQLLRCDFIIEVWHPDEQTRRLRPLMRRRAARIAERTRLKNRIRSVLAGCLIDIPKGLALFSEAGIQWLKTLPLDRVDRIEVEACLRQFHVVEQNTLQTDQLLAALAYQRQDAKLLMTLPGVDFRVALALLAAWGSVDRFVSGSKAASYLGLVPSTKQSANKCYHGPITKQGNTLARFMLIQAAQHYQSNPGPLGHFFRRLKKRKCHNLAVVATARKLAIIAWHMLCSQEPYRYALPRTTADKLARLRIRATGQKRKTGPAAGSSPAPTQSSGVPTRAIPALTTVLGKEGLPGPSPTKPAELRVMADIGLADWIASINRTQLIARAKTARPPHPATATAATG